MTPIAEPIISVIIMDKKHKNSPIKLYLLGGNFTNNLILKN